jgi:hypothetical protein
LYSYSIFGWIYECICYGLFLCAGCMYAYAYRFLCIPILFKSRNNIQYTSKN